MSDELTEQPTWSAKIDKRTREYLEAVSIGVHPDGISPGILLRYQTDVEFHYVVDWAVRHDIDVAGRLAAVEAERDEWIEECDNWREQAQGAQAEVSRLTAENQQLREQIRRLENDIEWNRNH